MQILERQPPCHQRRQTRCQLRSVRSAVEERRAGDDFLLAWRKASAKASAASCRSMRLVGVQRSRSRNSEMSIPYSSAFAKVSLGETLDGISQTPIPL